jgi:hypothetical protein
LLTGEIPEFNESLDQLCVPSAVVVTTPYAARPFEVDEYAVPHLSTVLPEVLPSVASGIWSKNRGPETGSFLVVARGSQQKRRSCVAVAATPPQLLIPAVNGFG